MSIDLKTIPALADVEPVKSTKTPLHLDYEYTAGAASSRFLRAVKEKKLMGQRCPQCGKVYLPPRGACPTDGVPTTDEVELPHTGTVTTFCVVNVPFLHVVKADESAMATGMRVTATWKDEREGHITDLACFVPEEGQ